MIVGNRDGQCTFFLIDRTGYSGDFKTIRCRLTGRPIGNVTEYSFDSCYSAGSRVTPFENGRKRAEAFSYTVVYIQYTLRIRSRLSVLHGSVLRIVFRRVVYGGVRRHTLIVYAVDTVANGHIRQCRRLRIEARTH